MEFESLLWRTSRSTLGSPPRGCGGGVRDLETRCAMGCISSKLLPPGPGGDARRATVRCHVDHVVSLTSTIYGVLDPHPKHRAAAAAREGKEQPPWPLVVPYTKKPAPATKPGCRTATPRRVIALTLPAEVSSMVPRCRPWSSPYAQQTPYTCLIKCVSHKQW